jgi:two-component system sensor histidine kinase/response regulator
MADPDTAGPGAAAQAAGTQPSVTVVALERLAGVPGLDVARGVAVLRGNAALYLNLLGGFVTSHAEDMTRLAASLDAGDHATARRLAHTLKGTAATLRADRLAEHAERLQQMLPANAEWKILPDVLRLEMHAIDLEFMAIAAALPPVSPVPPALPLTGATPLDKEALHAVLEQLDALLAQSDTAAMALFDQHATLLRATLGGQGQQLGREIGRFEFEAAQRTLRATQLRLGQLAPEEQK